MGATDRAEGTRRTEGVLTGGRSARVVESVLRATAEELSRTGYAALRVEDVAERSGVNKTTIYRRWPSKAELVAAALAAVLPEAEPIDTGDVRGDLLAAVRQNVALASSRLGRGLWRVLQTERTDPEVEAMARTFRDRQRAARTKLIARAIERGELPASVDARLVAELVFAPIASRVLTFGEKVDEEIASEIIDTVLAGVRARGKAEAGPWGTKGRAARPKDRR